MNKREVFLCDYGCNSIAKHKMKSSNKWCCSENVNSCLGMKKKQSLKKKGINPFSNREHPRGMLGKTHPFKDKNYNQIYGIEKAQEIKQKISKNKIENNHWLYASEETKKIHAQKARININKRYETGWMPKAGRCKKYEYIDKNKNTSFLDGTWELNFVKWLEKNNIKWKRNKKRFKYIHLNGHESHYTPDFWIEDWNTYLEIKGYVTELDKCKWSQFNENLIVWKKENIIKIIKELES